jgi:hypothetical protein
MQTSQGIWFVVGALVLIVSCFLSELSGRYRGHRDGQIDAINGKLLWELRQMPDNSTRRVRKRPSDKRN